MTDFIIVWKYFKLFILQFLSWQFYSNWRYFFFFSFLHFESISQRLLLTMNLFCKNKWFIWIKRFLEETRKKCVVVCTRNCNDSRSDFNCFLKNLVRARATIHFLRDDAKPILVKWSVDKVHIYLVFFFCQNFGK